MILTDHFLSVLPVHFWPVSFDLEKGSIITYRQRQATPKDHPAGILDQLGPISKWLCLLGESGCTCTGLA